MEISLILLESAVLVGIEVSCDQSNVRKCKPQDNCVPQPVIRWLQNLHLESGSQQQFQNPTE